MRRSLILGVLSSQCREWLMWKFPKNSQFIKCSVAVIHVVINFCYQYFCFEIFFFPQFFNFFFSLLSHHIRNMWKEKVLFSLHFTLDAFPFTETKWYLHVSVLWKIWYAAGRNWTFVSYDVSSTDLWLILLTSHSTRKVQFLPLAA